MKYTNESEEIAIWVGLSIAWMLGGMLAWLFAVFAAHEPLVGEGLLTLLAVAACLISCALRLPMLTDAPDHQLLSKHVVWLLGLVANMNWFGFLCLRSETIAEVVPAGIIFLVGEMWLLPKALRGDCLPWFCESLKRVASIMRARPQRPDGHLQLASTQEQLDSTDEQLDSTDELGPVRINAEPANAIDNAGLSAGVQRRCTAGLDDEGRGYMSGEILVAFEREQATETLVIGFCPPFCGTPTLELEVTTLDHGERVGGYHDNEFAEAFNHGAEPDEVETRILACTPQGARILVKRVPADDSTELTLGWFACVDSLTGQRQPEAAIGRRTPQTLP